MKKIIRYSVILAVIVITIIIGSCSTTKKMSMPIPPPPASAPPRDGSSMPFKICRENEVNSNCKPMSPTATAADRGNQEEQRELP